MKRRDFLKRTAPIAASPFILNGLSMKAFATQNMLQLLGCEDVNDRVLILIQMKGGNDGLNMLIPVSQYADYANLRPDIRIKDTGSAAEKYIDLDSNLTAAQLTGLHPAMVEIKDLYNAGKAAFIHGVGYPDANKSHFKSTDLWLTGGDGTAANFNIGTGWVGRYLDYSFPGIAGNPTSAMPDPLGIELGDRKPSLGFHTESEHRVSINLTGQDPSGFYNVVSEIGNAPLFNLPNSEYGGILQHVMNLENSISVYSKRISDVFDAGTNAGTYPSSNLANQLKTVARLISGGSRTKVFLTSIGGFDTHISQTQQGANHLGEHAELLQEISQAVKAFQEDLGAMGLEDRAMTVTFSEFGRKAIQNGSNGTDHGTLAPMMLFGKHVEAGVLGDHIDLQNLDNTGAPAQNPTNDYRQVFTSLLQDWLGASTDALVATQFDPYESGKLPLIAASHVVPPECHDPFINAVGIEDHLFQFRAFPNPTSGLFRLDFTMDRPSETLITVFGLQGQIVFQEELATSAGNQQLVVDLSGHASGVYSCVIQNSSGKQSLKVVKM